MAGGRMGWLVVGEWCSEALCDWPETGGWWSGGLLWLAGDRWRMGCATGWLALAGRSCGLAGWWLAFIEDCDFVVGVADWLVGGLAFRIFKICKIFKIFKIFKMCKIVVGRLAA